MLLVAKCLPDGLIEPINEYVATTKLAENLAVDGTLSDAAMDNTIKAALEMQSIAMKEGAQNLIVTASSIIRNAKNRSSFLLKCNQCLNIYPQVLSSKEEARFAFLGSTDDMDASLPVVMINVGTSGSEIAYGTKNELKGVYCLDHGTMNLNETYKLNVPSMSFLPGFSPSKQARNALIKELEAKVGNEIYSWLADRKPVVLACGGVAVTYAAIIKKQFIYDRALVNFTESTRKELIDVYKAMSKINDDARRQIPGMDLDRVASMPAGLLILLTILSFYNFEEFSITDKGIRLGILKYFIQR